MSFDQARHNLTALRAVAIETHATGGLAPAALDLALEIARPKLAIYDFFYLALALAIELDCGYVTADRVFFDAIRPTAYGNRLVWVADPLR